MQRQQYTRTYCATSRHLHVLHVYRQVILRTISIAPLGSGEEGGTFLEPAPLFFRQLSHVRHPRIPLVEKCHTRSRGLVDKVVDNEHEPHSLIGEQFSNSLFAKLVGHHKPSEFFTFLLESNSLYPILGKERRYVHDREPSIGATMS